MTTEDTFERTVAEYTKVFITDPRTEADELVAGLEGERSYAAQIRRRRARSLRMGATKSERYRDRLLQMVAQDEAAAS